MEIQPVPYHPNKAAKDPKCDDWTKEAEYKMAGGTHR